MRNSFRKFSTIFVITCTFAVVMNVGEAFSQTLPLQFISDLNKTLSDTDKIISSLQESQIKLEELKIELEKTDPLAESISEMAINIQLSSNSTASITNSAAIFNFIEAHNILHSDQEKLDSCISRKVYASALNNISGTLNQMIGEIDSKISAITSASGAIDISMNDIDQVAVLLDEAVDNGFLSKQESEKVIIIIGQVDMIYLAAMEKILEISKRLIEQKPPLEDRASLASSKYQEFLSNPQKCYYIITGQWLKKLASGRSAVLCITGQNKFSYSGYGFGMSASGKKGRRRDFSGSIEGDRTVMNYPNYGTFTHKIFEPGTSSARICDDPDHRKCFSIAVGVC